MSDALARYDEVFPSFLVRVITPSLHIYDSMFVPTFLQGFVLDVLIGICFPGWQVPVWFNHRSVGSVLKPELPRHWSDVGLTGIALCAVVSFTNYQARNSRFLVRCTSEFTEKDGSCIRFSCILGGWTEHGSDEPREIESGHVFIGYTSWLHIKKCDGEVENRNKCVATEASVKFEVTDGTRPVTNCEVLKCGFSLIYAPTETDYSFSTEVYSGVTPATNDISHGEGMSGSTTEGNIQRYYQNGSEASLGPRMDSEIREEVRSEADNDAGPSRSNVGIGDDIEDKESSSSRMDASLDGESTRTNSEKRKHIGVDDSTSDANITNEINNTTCLSFIDGIFHCLRS